MSLRSPTVLFLILVNLIPIFGVLFLGWDLYSIMLLYWMENVIIGLFNIIKMLFASKIELEGGNGDTSSNQFTYAKSIFRIGQKLIMTPFFIFHYGVFCLVHGMFIAMLFGMNERYNGTFESPVDYLLFSLLGLGSGLSWALLSMVLSHGLSLVLNYFGQKEYLRVSVSEQMFQPYQRIMILHFTIILGGFLTLAVGAPVVALIFMAILKIAIDVWAHLREHKKLQNEVLTTI